MIPFLIFTGAGVTGAAADVLGLALLNPDVSWDRKDNPEPWNKLGPNDQYKFPPMNVDYSNLKIPNEDSLMKCFTIKLLRMKVFQKPSAQFPT